MIAVTLAILFSMRYRPLLGITYVIGLIYAVWDADGLDLPGKRTGLQGDNSRSAGTATVIAISLRLLLGTWMLFWGFNYFLRLEPQPLGIKSNELHLAFIHSGMFAFAKAIEILLGLSLLLNRFVPLFLLVGYPITVIVAYMDLMEDILWVNVSGYVIISVHTGLFLYYLPYYHSLFKFHAYPQRPVSNWRTAFTWHSRGSGRQRRS
jgi:hypothetical protein